MPRRHNCVHAAAHFEHVDIFGALEHAEAVRSVGNQAGPLKGAVLVDACQVDAANVARPDHGGVRVAAHLEHVDVAGAVGATAGRAGRLEGAVFVDADQLDAAVPRGHGGVRAAAHLERVDCLYVVHCEAARAAAGRAGRLEGAVLVDAYQLDAACSE